MLEVRSRNYVAEQIPPSLTQFPTTSALCRDTSLYEALVASHMAVRLSELDRRDVRCQTTDATHPGEVVDTVAEETI